MVPWGRYVPGGTFEALNSLFKRLNEKDLSPHFVSAIVMTQAKCPQSFVQSKACNFIKPAEIAKLASAPQLTDMVAAENLIKRCSEIADESHIDVTHITQVKATLMIRLVRFVMQKQGSPSYEKLEHIAHDFVVSINEHMPMHIKMDNPWEGMAKKDNAAGKKINTIVEYNKEGEPANVDEAMFKKLGFEVDMIIQSCKGDGTYGKVVDINDKNYTVTVARCDKAGAPIDKGQKYTMREFIANWKKTSTTFVTLTGKLGTDTVEFKQQCAKSYITSCLYQASVEHPPPDVRFQTKPTRGVFANIAYESGKLVLLPISTRITCVETKDIKKINASTLNFEVGVNPPIMEDHSFYMAPMINKEFIAHIWGVQSTDTKKKANMEFKDMPMTINVRKGKNKKDGGTGTEIVFQILVNAKKIDVNEELLFFQKPSGKSTIKDTTGKRSALEAFGDAM